MDDINITLLTSGQVFGDENTKQLEIFKIRGTKAAVSDWAIATGVSVNDDYYVTDRETLDNRACWYYLKDRYGDGSVQAVDRKGDKGYLDLDERVFAVRPTLSFSKIKNMCSNIVRADDGVLEADFGLLPAKLHSRQLQNKLKKLLYVRKLTKLSGTYTTDSRKCEDFYNGFRAKENSVYEYQGIKYARVKIKPCYHEELVKFNNGEIYKDGDYVWVELQPIRLWIDEETDTAVFEKGVISGLQFNKGRYYDGNFEKTDLGYFLNNIFLKEILQFNTEVKSIDVVEKTTVEQIPKKQNIIALLLRKLIDVFPFLKSILGSSYNQKALTASSNNLAKIDADPSKDKVSDIKSKEKNEEKLEINNKEINKLCDYIKEKSLLLVPTKSKEVLEKLKQLLDTHEREVKDLDSEMYIKYNLTLMTYEDSRLNLWRELSSLKVEVDSLLKDTNNILNYGEEYVIYLRNCVEKYQSLKYGSLPGDGAIKNLVNLVKKIDGEYDKIFPYYRDEILKLIFLSIHFLNEINPWAIDIYVTYQKEGIDELQILDKLITWFELYFLTNKDKLSSELQAKYYNIKMTMSKDNKFAYIVELAKIIDTTLLLEKDNDKKK